MEYRAQISVRELVEFILRYGDIDNRKETGIDPDAMLEGTRIHKKIQKSMPVGYNAEVSLKEEFIDGDIVLTVDGRADGIWYKTEDGVQKIIIDEIKGVYENLNFLEDPRPLHLAQAKCYAAMYVKNLPDIVTLEESQKDHIDVQITYANIETEEIKRFRFTFGARELRDWFEDTVGRYMVWVRWQYEHFLSRNKSIEELEFPFEYRSGQKEVARDVYRAITREKNLFIQAPTGVGKTLSVTFPTLKSMPAGLCDRIFYLTAKNVTASVATDTFSFLGEKGLDIKAVHISAKEKVCRNGECICNPDACPYADGHYDRLNDAVYDIITHEDVMTRDIIGEYAQKHMVCPYSFALNISDWCDVIIGDYNYAFDPGPKLKKYFGENAEACKSVLLIDEAHNLVSRASEMFSGAIIKEDILECIRQTKGMSKRLTSVLTSANKKMLELKRRCEGEYTLFDEDDLSAFGASMSIVELEISKLLEQQRYFDTRDEVLNFYFAVRTFNGIFFGDLKGYRIYGRIGDDGKFMIKLLCIDPSESLKESLEIARSAIFFSATLLPINYYKELLTGDTNEYAIYAETSFTQDQRLLVYGNDVSSKYTRRNENEYSKIAQYIRTAVSSKKGNYMVFFPSYDYLGNVSKYLEDLNIIIQNQYMREEEREEFLRQFNEDNKETLIGLCVMGGVFAEGIDLADEKLIGAVIVGTGLPMINTESEIAKNYFDEDGRDGFAYAYRYPGMNKVMQAAGRVIRKETDHGIILLLDERFGYSENTKLFPKEWSDIKKVSLEKVKDELDNFWGIAFSKTE